MSHFDAAIGRSRMMTVHVSKNKDGLFNAMKDLAAGLGCSLNDLIWDGLAKYMETPPTVAPAGSKAPRTGSAAGFWLVHTLDNGRLVGVRIVEVASRAKIAGKAFYRYQPENEKTRPRALKQVQDAAIYDLRMVGLPVPEQFEVESLVPVGEDGETE